MFKLEIKIDDSLQTEISFDGQINHIVLLGVLDCIKHSVLCTQDVLAAQQALKEMESAQDTAEGEA